MGKKNITILGVFAHPDDEFIIGGLLTRANKNGYKTHLICATRGEAGHIRNYKDFKPEDKSNIRTNELKKSCNILGVSSIKFLELKDSEGDKWILDDAVNKLYGLIKDIAPDIVITFDANGGNGHPDHIAISYLTVEAFKRYDINRKKKLYYSTLLPEAFALQYMANANFPEMTRQKLMKFIAVPNDKVTCVLRLNEDEAKNKFKLLDNYKSQFPDENGNYYKMPLEILKKLTIYESYYLNDYCIDKRKRYDFVDFLN